MDEEFTLIWRALADPSRRMILDLLRERPRTTGELCAQFALSRFAIMKHLNVLEEAGLIVVKREGRERWNHINVIPLQQMYERWLKPYEAGWASSLLHLKQYVEGTGERKESMSEQSTDTATLQTVHIEMEIVFKATPEKIFQALTTDIAPWWPRDASWGRGKMVLEPQVGKPLYEDFGNGDGAHYGIITFIDKNKSLRIDGGHGMGRLAQGYVQFELVPKEDGTTLLQFTHEAFGILKAGTQERFTQGWHALLDTHLRGFVE